MQVPLKLGVLVSHPIQYFVPVYRKLARTPGIDLTVLYRTRVGVDAYHDPGFGQTVQWDIPLLDGYAHQFLSVKNSLKGVEWSVISALLGKRFDVLLVHGYNSLTNLLAILVAKMSGTKVLMRGDTRLEAHHKRPGLKALFKRMVFRCCDGFVAIGSLNREYYLQHGVPPERVFFAPFSVRNEQFAASPEMRARHRQTIRAELGLDGDSLIVLFASKLIKRKRADDLIRAFARLADRYPLAYLVIVGSGEVEANLRALAAASVGERVRFMGFRNQSQLPALYAASDVFVLPADSEPWGLVINELMAAGIPVVVSNEIGAVPDLVQGQETGFVFPCGNIEELAKAIGRLLAEPALRAQMSVNAVRIIRRWDVDESAAGIVNAALEVTGQKNELTA
jgi:glycosyltransferase involved in cell wall biosynthesis